MTKLKHPIHVFQPLFAAKMNCIAQLKTDLLSMNDIKFLEQAFVISTVNKFILYIGLQSGMFCLTETSRLNSLLGCGLHGYG